MLPSPCSKKIKTRKNTQGLFINSKARFRNNVRYVCLASPVTKDRKIIQRRSGDHLNNTRHLQVKKGP